MKYKKWLCLIFVFFYHCYSSIALAEDKVLVILASSNVKKMSVETVSNLYSFRQKLMPNYQRVKLTSLPINSDDTIYFTKKVFNYYPYQLKRIWDQAIFSGKARSPKSFQNTDDLLNFISSTNNAIGYLFINTSALPQIKETSNVIAIIH